MNALKNGSATIVKRKVRAKSKLKPILFSATILLVLTIIAIVYLFFPSDVFEKSGDRAIKWENSIAVLPFADMSPEGDQEWFCDGMTDQILSNLSKFKTLKVISRTSVLKYKNTNKSVPEIGKELNVDHVLEGSVRKIGDRVRVTAQLISTQDDFHIWSEDYEEEYSALFALQSEVSEKIARSLLQTLSREELDEIADNKPNNLEAWEYYSRGRHIYGKFFESQDDTTYLNTSKKMLKKALVLDPEFAPSYAMLAEINNTYHNIIASTREEKQKYLKLQEKYVTAGLRVNPNSADMYWAQGGYFIDKGDMRSGLESYLKSLWIEPSNEDANFSIGYHYCTIGLHKQGVKYLTKVVEVNPISEAGYRVRSMGYEALGNLEQAGLDIKKAVDI